MKKQFLTIKNLLVFCVIIVLFIILILNSKVVGSSVKKGMLLCCDVIIPTLFPFLVLSLFISKSGMLNALPFPKKYRYFQKYLGIFILSLLGGYPIGAKLLNDAYEKGVIDKKSAELLLFCSVNAGPAFTILVVGGGILGSTKLGWILYLSQIISSLLTFILISLRLSKEEKITENADSLTDSFVLSVSDASVSMLSMSGYIIICTAIIGILKNLSLPFILKKVLFLTIEISNAILETKNIYVLSLILCFSGFSIIFQILFITKSFKPNAFKVLLSRIVNASLSAALAFAFLKIFKISTETLSNTTALLRLSQNNSLVISFMLLVTCIAFIYSINAKKYCGKFSADIF